MKDTYSWFPATAIVEWRSPAEWGSPELVAFAEAATASYSAAAFNKVVETVVSRMMSMSMSAYTIARVKAAFEKMRRDAGRRQQQQQQPRAQTLPSQGVFQADGPGGQHAAGHPVLPEPAAVQSGAESAPPTLGALEGTHDPIRPQGISTLIFDALDRLQRSNAPFSTSEQPTDLKRLMQVLQTLGIFCNWTAKVIFQKAGW